MADSLEPPEAWWPHWSKLVHCAICDAVYQSEELFYVEEIELWVCRSYPECQGVKTDIRVLDSDEPGPGQADSK